MLLVERGLANDTWLSRVPLLSNPFAPIPGPTLRQKSLADSAIGGRIHELINGSGLGGTSRVNAMLYTRGLAAEYNAWSASGRKGWSYEEVLPFFKKSQHSLLPNPSPEAGVDGEKSRDFCQSSCLLILVGEWKTRTYDSIYFEHINR